MSIISRQRFTGNGPKKYRRVTFVNTAIYFVALYIRLSVYYLLFIDDNSLDKTPFSKSFSKLLETTWRGLSVCRSLVTCSSLFPPWEGKLLSPLSSLKVCMRRSRRPLVVALSGKWNPFPEICRVWMAWLPILTFPSLLCYQWVPFPLVVSFIYLCHIVHGAFHFYTTWEVNLH